MNGFVAGGWGATAGMLALYAWRVIYRGRVLTRALPSEAVPEAPPPASPGGPAPAQKEVRAWP